MREFQIMVDPLGAVTVSGSSRLLGYGGEHNVARLNVNFDDFEQSVFKDAGYYRIALGDYYSDAIYSENGVLSYLVPFEAVTPPMVYCQIIGYTDKEGEPVKIAKSSVFTMEVKFSKVPRAAISNSTDVFERTLASCEVALKSSLEASNESRLYAESAALSMERSVESSAVAIQSANSARVAAEEAKEALGTLENFATLHNNVANAIKRTAKGNVVSVSDVSPIEHEVQVKLISDTVTDLSKVKLYRYGKNLIPYTYKGLNRTYRGITFVDNGDGTITANGTNTSDTDTAYVSIPTNQPLPKGTYVLKNIGVPSTQCRIRYVFDTYPQVIDVSINDTILEVTDEKTFLEFRLVVNKGVTLNNFVFKPQLEVGTVPTEYESYIEPMEYSVNAEGYISNESRVIYTESDGNDFVTASSDENCLVLDTSKIPSDATKLHLVAEFETVAGNGNSHVEFNFTKDVIPSDGIYGVQYDNTNTYDITNVTISEENGFPEKITVTWGVTNLVSYTAEITSGEGEANVKSIYPSMTFLTDTDGVLIDVEYNRDINKAFAELQAAIINLGGTLNV